MLKTRTRTIQTLSEPLIQAIPTTYKGVPFRSRLEVRWAKMLTRLGHRWEYEKQCFSLPSGGYLPDFWLPDLKMWAEVKPGELPSLAKAKLMELTSHTGFDSLRFEGFPHIGAIPAYGVCMDLAQDNYKGVESKTFVLGPRCN